MTIKGLHGVALSVLLVLAIIASVAGTLAHDERMQRLGVILLVIVGLMALTDWMRAAVK